MTSEEALTIVINAALGDTPSKLIFNKKYAEIVNILTADLNMLEVIKELFTVEMVDDMIRNIEDLSNSVTLKDGTYTFQTPENQIKVVKLKRAKEWLNDKQ